jgi:hypothetical protein
LTRLEDKYDHEGRIFPYIISGLFDHHDSIRSMTFEILEEIGQVHEEENEEKLREVKQFAYQNEWLCNGLVKEKELVYPFPILHRPRLGARIIVRTYVRRYIKGLFQELGDWIEEHRERCSHLMLYSVIYAEDYMTQFLDEITVCFYKVILDKNRKLVYKNISQSLRLLGRYCRPAGYHDLIISAMR